MGFYVRPPPAQSVEVEARLSHRRRQKKAENPRPPEGRQRFQRGERTALSRIGQARPQTILTGGHVVLAAQTN